MFKGILIEKDDAGYRASVQDIDASQLPEGDVTVRVDYSSLNYKDGLAINAQLAKKQRAAQLGLSAQLHFDGDAVTVTLTGSPSDSELRLLLSHPVEADRDFTVPLVRTASGMYRGSVAHAVAPHWHWTLQGLRSDDWRLDGVVQTGDFNRVPTG